MTLNNIINSSDTNRNINNLDKIPYGLYELLMDDNIPYIINIFDHYSTWIKFYMVLPGTNPENIHEYFKSVAKENNKSYPCYH